MEMAWLTPDAENLYHRGDDRKIRCSVIRDPEIVDGLGSG